MKPIKAWAGYVEGKIDMGWIEQQSFNDSLYGIFRTKHEAKSHYQDVRPVLITPIITKKKK